MEPEIGSAAMETLREVRLLRLKTERDRERARRVRTEIGMAMGNGQAEALADIEREILSGILDTERKIAEISGAVDALPATQAMAMRLRYFEGLSWRQVAHEMHYTPRRCMQLHVEAEKKLGAGSD